MWSTTSLNILYVIDPYLETGAGDLFSVAWSPSLQTIYIGCQNTSLQWYTFKPTIPSGTSTPTRKAHKFFDSYPQFDPRPPDLNARNPGSATPDSGSSTPIRKAHKFFDSYPQFEPRPADLKAHNPGSATPIGDATCPCPRLQIPARNVLDSAHYGYIYCVSIIEGNDKHLVTGGGDEQIKVGQSFALYFG